MSGRYISSRNQQLPVRTGTGSMNSNPEKRDAESEALAKLEEAMMDTSNLPEVADWSKGVRDRFYRPLKQWMTIRLDADVVAWVKARANNGRYQTSINQALREYMKCSR
jgi:uncharacterized protein (DUF4415 family)